ncbi:Protein lifeguard 4 [Chionoecetes opilio]|uniref:Protein lifeguard 4 n=1 Tax=Chionoecetes opilio TaxID=41210 RepID=A0A8J4Y7Z5_CHIOP|nr:Protein lifeguard 4 [Chionoecetes opilio]
MDTTVLIPQDGEQAEKGGIVDDFMYGSNVASSHIYVRMGFLRKVYGLLFVQILVTTVVAAALSQTQVLRQTLHENPWVLMMCMPFTFGLLIALHVKRHQVPINFMLLAAFTVVEAITVGWP